jgi:hypothetical protein
MRVLQSVIGVYKDGSEGIRADRLRMADRLRRSDDGRRTILPPAFDLDLSPSGVEL